MILGADPGIEVVGQGDDGNEAVTLVQKHRPDVLLMDVRMPGLDGIAATTAVSALPNPPKIIMLTTYDMDEYVFQALEAGASGLLLKDTPPPDLARGVLEQEAAGPDRKSTRLNSSHLAISEADFC